MPFIHGLKGDEFSDLVDDALEKYHFPLPANGMAISNLRARKEAARAGIGVTVLPHFTVKDEVQRKTLKILTIKEGSSPDTQLMIVQGHAPFSKYQHNIGKKCARR